MNARAITKAAAALAGMAMAVLGLAAPAHAGQWEGVDPAHDVAAYDCKPGRATGRTPRATPAPTWSARW